MGMVSTLVVPQWQGSAARGAPHLARGAGMVADLIRGRRRLDVVVDDTAGATRDGVRSLDVLVRHARRIAEAHAALPTAGLTVTVGGDCSVDLMPIAAASRRHGDRLALVWLDAHADLNVPDSSPSHAFHGMVLRTLLGEGPAELRPAVALAPERVVLAGVRDLDPPEQRYLDERGIRRVSAAALADPTALVDAVAATGASAVYVHFDLDALDPGAFSSVGYPVAGGVAPRAAAAAISALAARFELAGLAITELQPGEDLHALRADLAVLGGLIAALPIA
jgi:arginase